MAGELGFEGLEYSGLWIGDHHTNSKSLAGPNRRTADAGVWNVLILVDLHDALGAKDVATREANVAEYEPWLEAAATLECIGVRVNPILWSSNPRTQASRATLRNRRLSRHHVSSGEAPGS
jgi:hypothetical protein